MKRDQDRDRATDELLRRSLGRYTTGVPGGACIDADTTAALFDGALSRAERTRIENHAAACVRCQQLLASVARTHSAGAGEPLPAWWKRLPSLRWAVPLAAAATALALWVAVPDRQNEMPGAVEERGAAPSLSREPDSKPAAAAEASKAPSPETPGPTPGRPLRLDKSDRPRSAQEKMSADAAARAAEPRATDAVAPGSGSGRAAAAPAPPPASLQLGQRAAMQSLLEIASSDPAARWRIRGNDGVEVSIDGGRTWLFQPLEMAPSILTGSSPGPSVCWLVGRGGVVVKTVDGRTWEAMTSPDTADLVSVTAASATEAVVATSDGRRFTTKDGGRTWTKAPLQENLAAPF